MLQCPPTYQSAISRLSLAPWLVGMALRPALAGGSVGVAWLQGRQYHASSVLHFVAAECAPFYDQQLIRQHCNGRGWWSAAGSKPWNGTS
jgi:hypothetical protein